MNPVVRVMHPKFGVLASHIHGFVPGKGDLIDIFGTQENMRLEAMGFRGCKFEVKSVTHEIGNNAVRVVVEEIA